MALSLYKHDCDIPDDLWAVDIDDDTLYLTAVRSEDGKLSIEPDYGYEVGSAPYRHEKALFSEHRQDILEAAEKVVSRVEPVSSPSP